MRKTAVEITDHENGEVAVVLITPTGWSTLETFDDLGLAGAFMAGYQARGLSERKSTKVTTLPTGRTAREVALIAEAKPPFNGAIWFGPRVGWGFKPRAKKRPALTARRIDPKYGVQLKAA
jgi:hypothetical protein